VTIVLLALRDVREAAATVVREVADDGRCPPTLAGAYHQALHDIGIVNYDRVLKAERERGRKAMLQPLREASDDHYCVDRDEYAEAIADVPDQIREELRGRFEALALARFGDETVEY